MIRLEYFSVDAKDVCVLHVLAEEMQKRVNLDTEELKILYIVINTGVEGKVDNIKAIVSYKDKK